MECFQSVTDYLQPVTELGTPKNMAVALPGMTLQPLYKGCEQNLSLMLAPRARVVLQGLALYSCSTIQYL